MSSTRLDNGRALAVLDGAGAGAGGLESPDNIVRSIVNDLAKDNMSAVEPISLSSGDEELGAVGVGASVGHGQKELLVVLQLEVLIGELLAVNGLATGAVAAGKVTTLEHETGNDAVERRALVTESLLASAESAEVLSGLGHHAVVEVEIDDPGLLLDSGSSPAVLEDGALPVDLEVDRSVGHCCGYGEESSCLECV